MNIDDLLLMKKSDPDDMYHKIIHLPEQIHLTYQNAKVNWPKNPMFKPDINRIVICGMGGSAISADIAKSAFGHLLPIEVVKCYELPYLDKKNLVIAISYSGNTAETISCLNQAIRSQVSVAAITSGGKIKELVDGKFPWVNVESGFPPRAAIARLFFALIRLLEEFKIIPSQAEVVKKTTANLIMKAGAIASSVPAEENLAKDAAKMISGKIPIIYSSEPALFALAYRWKCQINENAKYPAFCHTFPEMNHNEIEGWEVQGFEGKFIPIILGYMQEKPQLQKRKNVMKNIFSNLGIEYLEFFVEGNSFIEQIFSLIYLGDMISFYLAILRKVDPTAIDFINQLKQNI